jgi:hypothetical protein
MKMERESDEQDDDDLMNQIKDLEKVLQLVKASVCCMLLAVHCYWDMLLVAYHKTL